MTRKLIEDSTEAKQIADAYGVTDSILADAERRLPEVLAAQVGIVITAKRSAPVDHINGPFEFVLIAYFAGFLEDNNNGWSVFRWSEVTWDELPFVAEQMERIEKELLPQAVGQDTALPRLEAYRKGAA